MKECKRGIGYKRQAWVWVFKKKKKTTKIYKWNKIENSLKKNHFEVVSLFHEKTHASISE